jgi:signal transduction histidine kinase/ligand-binding sensor domain-containing protein
MTRILWLALLVFVKTAIALDPQKTITQFVHTAWTEQEGAPSDIRALAQTNDGYLWLGTAAGLFRFDGVRFTRFIPIKGEEFQEHPVRQLYASRDGSLWISYSNGLLNRLSRGHVTSFFGKSGNGALSIAEAPDGAIVAGTSNGFLRFQHEAWTDMGKALGLPANETRALYYDRAGTLWAVSGENIFYLPPGRNQFVLGPRCVFVGLSPFAETPDGVTWIAEVGRSAHPALSPKTADGLETEVRVGASSVVFDRDGGLWIGTWGDGLRRIAMPSRIAGRSVARFDPLAEEYTSKAGLSSNLVDAALVDREGNVWWGTARGLDRFRESTFSPVSAPYSDEPRSILATPDGSLLMAPRNKAELLRIDSQGRQQQIVPERGRLASMFEERSGKVWVATVGQGLARLDGNRLMPVSLSGVTELNSIDCLTLDPAGGWWFSDAFRGLFHFSGGALTQVKPPAAALAGCVYTDSRGRVWISHTGSVYLYHDGHLTKPELEDGAPMGRVFVFQEDGAGNLWAGGENGIAKFVNSHFRKVTRGFAGLVVYGMLEDSDHFWWLATDTGVLRARATDLDHALEDSSYSVPSETFNLLDGMPGLPSKGFPRPLIARTADGRVWFVNSNGLSFVDPRRIPGNTVPPPVVIETVAVNGTRMPTDEGIELEHTRNDLEIDYTALSLSIPERVRFRYKLEGAESTWHDAGTRRVAFYNHLPPHNYRFRVIACNNDGVWNESGASWNFKILPAFYQTGWFYSLCVLTGVLFLASAYRLRMGQIVAENNSRFQERLDERTRLARELHDTMLQTIQGSKLVADDALELCTDPRTRETLGRLSGWLERAAEEGRSALNSLRASTAEGDNLAEELRSAGEECVFRSPIRFDLLAEGGGRQLHPIVHDEVFRIGYEAIRNAVSHSKASRLSVELSFTDSLTLRVRDNGKGFDPNEAARITDRHFGLLGMRERASRIGGQLMLKSSPGRGTLVEVVVPRNIAFRHSHAGEKHFDKLRRLLKPGKFRQLSQRD